MSQNDPRTPSGPERPDLEANLEARLSANPPPAPPIDPAFRAALRDRLLSRRPAARASAWSQAAGSLAGLALLAAFVILAIKTLPGSPPPAGSLVAQETTTPTSSAGLDIPAGTETPTATPFIPEVTPTYWETPTPYDLLGTDTQATVESAWMLTATPTAFEMSGDATATSTPFPVEGPPPGMADWLLTPTATPLPLPSTPTPYEWTPPPATPAPTLAWSLMPADGPGRLVFSTGSQVVSTGQGGGQAVTIAGLPEASGVLALELSPDQRRLLFAAFAGAGSAQQAGGQRGTLYAAALDGSGQVKLSEDFVGGAMVQTARWLDNERVVFVAEDGLAEDGLAEDDLAEDGLAENGQAQTAIYTIQSDGSGLTRLSEPQPALTHWTLAAVAHNRVIWQSAAPVDGQVRTGAFFQTALDGSGTARWGQGVPPASLVPSPDGMLAAYVLQVNPLIVALSDEDGGNAQPVWQGEPDVDAPPLLYWSPDGRYVLIEEFHRYAGDRYRRVYQMFDRIENRLLRLPSALDAEIPGSSLPAGYPPRWVPGSHWIVFEHFTWPHPRLMEINSQLVTEALVNYTGPVQTGSVLGAGE